VRQSDCAGVWGSGEGGRHLVVQSPKPAEGEEVLDRVGAPLCDSLGLCRNWGGRGEEGGGGEEEGGGGEKERGASPGC